MEETSREQGYLLGRPGSLAVCRSNEEDEQIFLYGRTAIMATNRCFFHLGTRISFQSSSSGICSDQFSIGTCFFLQERRFLLQLSRH